MKTLLLKPVGLIFLLVIAIFGGLYTALTLPISMYPAIQKPKIEVWVSNHGINTLEAYETYIDPIRESLESLEDAVDNEISFYTQGMEIVIDFDYSKDREEAKREVTVAFERLRANLPEEMRNRMWISYEGKSQGEFAGVFSSTGDRSAESIWQSVRPLVSPRLSGVEDVDLSRSGIYRVVDKQISIEFRQEELAKYGLFLPNVLRTIRNQVDNFPSGKIVTDRTTVYIRTVLNENKLRNFEDIVLRTMEVNSGAVSSVRLIRLKDVARVFVDKQPAWRSWKADGKPANIFGVRAKPGGNLWNISQGAKGIVAQIKDLLPEDIEFKIYLDPSRWISEAIVNLLISAFIGTMIAVLVILLFLGNIKSTLLIGISIPSSLILSVIAMKIADININMISLGGMALAVGMIVDSSIVVLENIFRTFEERRPQGFSDKLTAITAAVQEVKWPVIVSTLTSVIVFLPLSFTSAMANAILGDMSKVVVFALVISIVAALVYLPIFSRFLFSGENRAMPLSRRWNGALQGVCNSLYLKGLSWLMVRKRRALSFCILSFLLLGSISAFLIGGLKKEIVAEPEAMIFRANFVAKYVSGNDEVLALIAPYEKMMEEPRYKEKIIGHVAEARNKRGSLRILLKDDTDVEAFEKMMEKDFPPTPDLRVDVKQWNPTSLPLPEIRDAVVLFDPRIPDDFEDAMFLCGELEDLMEGEDSPFKQSWCNPWAANRQEIQIRPDRFKLQRMAYELGLNLSAKDLSDYVQTASYRKYVGEVFYGGQSTKVYAKYAEGFIRSAEDVKNLAIPLGREGRRLTYSLKTFADVTVEPIPPMVKVEDGVRNVVAYGNLKQEFKDRQKYAQQWLAGKISELRKEFPEHRATIVQKNPYKDIDESISSLSFSLLLSLILILVVLVLQFHSIRQSLIIMLAIPLGIFGVVISLHVFGSTLSLNSMLGVILLSGVAVNNSILIVDFFNSIRATGVARKEAVLRAVQIRFRPIMMTMMTTIFAMLPIALSLGAGGKTLQPLGVAVSGGLLVSTVFTLMVVPLVLFLAGDEEARA